MEPVRCAFVYVEIIRKLSKRWAYLRERNERERGVCGVGFGDGQ